MTDRADRADRAGSQQWTAVHCCDDPALSVLVMLVSRNVFHVVSALQSIVSIQFCWLIRSLVDPTLAAFIVCGPVAVSVTHTVNRPLFIYIYLFIYLFIFRNYQMKQLTSR